MCIGIS
jgi:hypothetical protein